MLKPILLALLLSISSANAATPADGAPPSRELSEQDMAEVVDFVVGNAVFALYHQAGHMIATKTSALNADSESEADSFALLTLLEPRSGAGDQTLIDAVDSWLLSYHQTASANPDEVVLPDRHSLDAGRATSLICGMVGADPTGFADVADASSLPPQTRAGCVASYQATKARLGAALAPLRRAADAPRSEIAVAYDAPEGGSSAEATMLRDNKVLEEVANRLADQYRLAPPPTIRAKSCGTVTSLYDAAKNELVLCYELSAYHTDLIIRDIESR